VEWETVERPADFTELMEVALPLLGPTDELNAELVAPMRRAKIFGLIEAELMVEFQERRYCAFAHTDGSDRFGFDQHNPPAAAANEFGERSRGHPARSAAANYYNATDSRTFGHGVSSR
jgi:hypothetical protein